MNTIHPFVRVSAGNNQCFCHTTVCSHYGPNNCSALREGKHFQDACKRSHSFNQSKETVMFMGLFLHMTFFHSQSL